MFYLTQSALSNFNLDHSICHNDFIFPIIYLSIHPSFFPFIQSPSIYLCIIIIQLVNGIRICQLSININPSLLFLSIPLKIVLRKKYFHLQNTPFLQTCICSLHQKIFFFLFQRKQTGSKLSSKSMSPYLISI